VPPRKQQNFIEPQRHDGQCRSTIVPLFQTIRPNKNRLHKWAPSTGAGQHFSLWLTHFFALVLGLRPFFSHRLISVSNVGLTCSLEMPQISQLAESRRIKLGLS
jgi:hypothetical protein